MSILKKRLFFVVTALLFSIFLCSTGQALTYDLNHFLEWDETDYGYTPTYTSFGTVTTADAGNNVTFTIDLVDSWKIQKFLFNFDETVLGNFGTDFFLSGSIGSTSFDIESINGGNWKAAFDLITDGLQMIEPITATISASDSYGNVIDLAISDFDLATVNGDYFGVHIGNFPQNEDGTGTEASIWVSARPGPEPVPEPATMLLLCTGLVGLAGVARRKKKK